MNDSSLPQAEGHDVERGDTGVACRRAEGDMGDLLRKRKRAYYRSYDRGERHKNVIMFMLDVANREMMRSASLIWMQSMKNELKEPFGLLAILNEEERNSGLAKAPPTY
jgi:hypothetical protein